jgi:hypothetical protein
VSESNYVADKNTVDDHGIKIPFRYSYIKGYCLESAPPYTTKTHHTYTLSKKSTFFYKEAVVYPYVQVEIRKNKFRLSNEEYVVVDNYITANGLAHI